MSQPASGQTTNYLLLAGTGLIWGSQFWLNKTALVSFSVLAIAGNRVVFGAAFLTILLLLGCERKSTRSLLSGWRDFLLIGILEASLPMVLIGWAQERMASSVTAVILGTVPLFATILEYAFVRGSTLSAKKIAGALIGFAAIVTLVSPDLARLDSSGGLLLPALAALLASASFASSMLLIRLRLGGYGPIRAAQGVLIGAAVTTIPIALWVTRPWTVTDFHPTLAAILALAALSILCSGVVYTLFVVLITRAGLAFASLSNYIVPIIGAFIGILLGGEHLSTALVIALGLIILSLWLSHDRSTAKA